jgi:hypothetical protein
MIKFTAQDVPRGWQSEKKDKVYAEFDEAGTLTHYGIYDGAAQHFIEIDHEYLTAQIDEFKRSDFKPKESGENNEQQLLRWVKKWINKIEHRPPQQCSFCGGLQDKNRKVIAGPRHYICNECLDICKDTLSQKYGSKP